MSAAYTYTDDQLTGISTYTTIYSLSYGDFGLRVSVRIGSRTLASYGYTDDENMYLETLAYGNGDVVKYTYDDQGRVTQKAYYENGATTASRTVTYVYDLADTLVSQTDSETGTTVRYDYDTLGRMIRQTGSVNGESRSLWYTYDAQGRAATVKDVYDGTAITTAYTYDGANRVAGVTVGSTSESYAYDGFNRLDKWYTYHNSTYLMQKDISYEAIDDRSGSSRPVMWSIVSTGGYSAIYNYTYDGNGNILSETLDGDTTTYVYDSANQLIRENNQKADKTWTWTYDAGGNILTKTEYAYTTGTLGTATNTVSYTYTDTAWGDLLTGYNGKNVTYDDAIGNLSTDGTWVYAWKQGRQLYAMSTGVSTWYFAYDADGMRTGRTSSSASYTYVYNGSQLSRMRYGDIELGFTYDATGRPLTVYYNGVVYYYALNLQGDVVAILNSSGAQVVGYTYDAWGRLLSTTGTMASTLGLHNPLRYRGYVYDTETGLYYLQSRYYNPEWGRFINADGYVSTGQGLLGNNMFAYCLNNPIFF